MWMIEDLKSKLEAIVADDAGLDRQANALLWAAGSCRMDGLTLKKLAEMSVESLRDLVEAQRDEIDMAEIFRGVVRSVAT